MSVLEFARGPALTVALVVFFVGTAWRLWAVFRRPRKIDHSAPRRSDTVAGGLRAIWQRMLPRSTYERIGMTGTINAYAYHIGIAVIVFAFAPHIGFIERLTGLSWSALPDGVTYVATAFAIVGLVFALATRLTDDVQRLLSNFDDYFTWLVTMLPIVTGMALIEQSYVPATPMVAPATPNPTLLAVHLLSLELMLIWFPFGKLAHAVLVFVARYRTGVEFTRKGAAL
jgi:nitrate reductase gamma subunit